MLKREVIGPGVISISFETSRLDAANAVQFRDTSARWVESENSGVLLDMSDLSFIDSSGLGALLGLHKRLSGKGKIVLCNLQPSVAKVISLTGLNKVFRVYASRDAAIVEGLKLSKFHSAAATSNDKVVEMVARAISSAFNKKIPSISEQVDSDSDSWREWLEEAAAAVEVVRNEAAGQKK